MWTKPEKQEYTPLLDLRLSTFYTHENALPSNPEKRAAALSLCLALPLTDQDLVARTTYGEGRAAGLNLLEELYIASLDVQEAL